MIKDEILRTSPDRVLEQGIRAWDVKTLRGTKAAFEELNIDGVEPSQTTFEMHPGGELLSLFEGGPIIAEFEVANGKRARIELSQEGDCVFLPGNVKVTFTATKPTYCLNELPAVRETSQVDWLVLDHKNSIAQYLAPGNHITAEAAIHPFLEGYPDTTGCFIYPLHHIKYPDGSSVVLIIPSGTEEMVYRGNEKIKVELLEGQARLHTAALDGTQTSVIDLRPDRDYEIKPNSIYKIEKLGVKAAVIRDTSPGFKPEFEKTLREYCAELKITERRGLINNLSHSNWKFVTDPLRNLRRMGR